MVHPTGPPLNFTSTKSLYNCWHSGEIAGQFAWDPVPRKFRGGPVKRTTLYNIMKYQKARSDSVSTLSPTLSPTLSLTLSLSMTLSLTLSHVPCWKRNNTKKFWKKVSCAIPLHQCTSTCVPRKNKTNMMDSLVQLNPTSPPQEEGLLPALVPVRLHLGCLLPANGLAH